MKTKRSDDTKHSMNAHSNYKFGMTVIRLLRFGRLRTNCTANFDRNYFCAQRGGICANFTVSLIVGRFYCCDQIRIDCVLNASDLSIFGHFVGINSCTKLRSHLWILRDEHRQQNLLIAFPSGKNQH